MTTNNRFQEFVKEQLVPLHNLRRQVAEDRAEKKAMVDAFNAEHADQWASNAVKEEALARMEAQVRAEALRLYSTVPGTQKTDIPGVTIRDTKVYAYDSAVALQWAIEHKVALKLDDALYKRLLESGNNAPGKVYTEATVALARDLESVVDERRI